VSTRQAIAIGALALVVGFVAGWALKGDTFNVAVFEAAGTWAGALASAFAVVIALYLGYESKEQRIKRDRQLDQDMTYTQHLLEGANRAQASRIHMTTIQLSPADPIVNVSPPYRVWSLILRIQNLGDETAHDFECYVDPLNTDAIRDNPDHARLREQIPYLQAGNDFGPTLYVPLPIDCSARAS
jgi:hypothetical protein